MQSSSAAARLGGKASDSFLRFPQPRLYLSGHLAHPKQSFPTATRAAKAKDGENFLAHLGQRKTEPPHCLAWFYTASGAKLLGLGSELGLGDGRKAQTPLPPLAALLLVPLRAIPARPCGSSSSSSALSQLRLSHQHGWRF